MALGKTGHKFLIKNLRSCLRFHKLVLDDAYIFSGCTKRQKAEARRSVAKHKTYVEALESVLATME